MSGSAQAALKGSLIGVALAASAVHSASDGNLAAGSGASSAASVEVGLVVEEMVRVSDVNDLMLQWDAAQQAFTAHDGICVFRNLSGSYSVTASSTEGNDAFVMAGQGGSKVPYAVHWDGQPLTPGSASSVRSDADTSRADCGGNANIDLEVRASADQVGSASRTGQHTDTLVLKVTAE